MGQSPAPVSPILRWAGSKRRLLSALCAAAPRTYDTYIEPFAGSASLFFKLRPQHAILGDINRDLIATYTTIRDHPRLVARQVAQFGGPDSYYDVRDLDAGGLPEVARAARFVYLNRFCFNGVYRVNRAGSFNVPRGSRMGALPREIDYLRAAITLRRAKLLPDDFDAVASLAGPGDFVYLDPPYPSHRAGYGEYGYEGKYTEVDEGRLIDCLTELDRRGAVFLLSYRSSESFLRRLPWNYSTVTVHESIAGQGKFRSPRLEILMTNNAG